MLKSQQREGALTVLYCLALRHFGIAKTNVIRFETNSRFWKDYLARAGHYVGRYLPHWCNISQIPRCNIQKV